MEHHKGKLAKNIKIEEKKPEERTVFTDKDFDKFEEEYDFFSWVYNKLVFNCKIVLVVMFLGHGFNVSP